MNACNQPQRVMLHVTTWIRGTNWTAVSSEDSGITVWKQKQLCLYFAQFQCLQTRCLFYRDWLCVLSLDSHICSIWLVFSVLLLSSQSQFGCLTAKPLVVHLQKVPDQEKQTILGCQWFRVEEDRIYMPLSLQKKKVKFLWFKWQNVTWTCY